MVGFFLHKSPPGFVAGSTRFKLKDYSQPAFIKQAAQLSRPFTPSRGLLKALDGLQGALVVSDLPGSNLFAANSIAGTASCNSTVFFLGEPRHREPGAGAEEWENDVGGSCGLTRSFASVDGLPVVIDDSLDAGPSLVSALTLDAVGRRQMADAVRGEFCLCSAFRL